MSDLKPCPFCGSEDIYETYSQEYSLGTKNPEIFCNSCKAIFAIEDDSPYMNCDEDFACGEGSGILSEWKRTEAETAFINALVVAKATFMRRR